MTDGSDSNTMLYSYIDIVPFGSSGSPHDILAVMSLNIPVVALKFATVKSLNSKIRLRTGPGADQSMHICVCVCEKERERERERGLTRTSGVAIVDSYRY